MVIFACMIAVRNPETKEVFLVHRDYEVSSMGLLMRNDIKNTFKFVVRESFPCLAPGTRNSVINDDKICHILMAKKPVGAYAFVDKEYPERIIFGFLQRVLNMFFEAVGQKWRTTNADDNLSVQKITAEFKRCQDFKKVDKLEQALDQIEETKVTLHESIKKVLENQGDLDKLVEKSKDLSAHAKQFYQTSKKMDKSCCTLI